MRESNQITTLSSTAWSLFRNLPVKFCLHLNGKKYQIRLSSLQFKQIIQRNCKKREKSAELFWLVEEKQHVQKSDLFGFEFHIRHNQNVWVPADQTRDDGIKQLKLIQFLPSEIENRTYGLATVRIGRQTKEKKTKRQWIWRRFQYEWN